MIAFALLLCLQEAALREDPSRNALLFLARHQNEDGSWGRAPAGCRCANPSGRPLDEADRTRLRVLVERLSSDEVDTREKAEGEILAFGSPAWLELETITPADGEAGARLRTIVDRLRLPPERGDLESTALALLAYISAGHTSLSKDTVEDICFGTVILKGLEWLHARKESPSSPLVLLALSESWGIRWRDAAEWRAKAVRDSEPKSAESLAWKAIALHSVIAREHVPAGFADVGAMARAIEERHDGGDRIAGLLSGRDLVAKRGLCGSGVTLMTSGTNRLLVLALDRPVPPGSGLADGGWKQLGERTRPGQRRLAFCERGSWDAEGLRRRVAETARRALAIHAYCYPYDSF